MVPRVNQIGSMINLKARGAFSFSVTQIPHRMQPWECSAPSNSRGQSKSQRLRSLRLYVLEFN